MVHNEIVKVILGPTVDLAAATGGAYSEPVGVAGEKYEVLSASLLPDVAVTADGTNYSIWTLANATQSLTIATRSYIATNSVALTPEALTLTAASRFVNGGDVISWTKTHSGSGVATRGRVIVRLRRIL